jgi:hypothetical protein
MSSGAVQIWPGTAGEEALIEDGKGCGRAPARPGRGQERTSPSAGFMPGMDIRAALTVVAMARSAPMGRDIDRRIRPARRHDQREWAVGMKFVVIARGHDLEPGTVLHTFGFPEPEIFGFLYVHPGAWRRWASSCRRGSTARCARLPLLAALHAASVSLALSRRRQAALVGREVAAGIRQARRAVSGRRRLRAHRRRLGQHQRAHRLRRGRSLDHRRATRRSACSNCSRPGKPFTKARTSTKPTCSGAARAGWRRKPRGREVARRLPERRGHRNDRHGARRPSAEASTLGGEPPAHATSIESPRGVLPRQDPAAEMHALHGRLRARGVALPRCADGPLRLAGQIRTTASCWCRTRTRC